MNSTIIISIILFFVPIIFSIVGSFILYETWCFLPHTHERVVKFFRILTIVAIVIYAIYSIIFAWSFWCIGIICLLIGLCIGISEWDIQPLIFYAFVGIVFAAMLYIIYYLILAIVKLL